MTAEQMNVGIKHPDVYCPIVQLSKMVDSQGEPDVHVKSNSDSVSVKDKNDVWVNISNKLETFIEDYTGADLGALVRKEAEKLYLRKLRASLKRLQRLISKGINSTQLFTMATGTLKLKLKKSAVVNPLPWNGSVGNDEMINTCSIDNMLFVCHVLQTYREDICSVFRQSEDMVLQQLHSIHLDFMSGRFAEGKFKWIQNFPTAERQHIWNIWGSEDDYFFSKLTGLATTYTIACSEDTCQEPVKVRSSRIITFK
jgi:hypothetical protein